MLCELIIKNCAKLQRTLLNSSLFFFYRACCSRTIAHLIVDPRICSHLRASEDFLYIYRQSSGYSRGNAADRRRARRTVHRERELRIAFGLPGISEAQLTGNHDEWHFRRARSAFNETGSVDLFKFFSLSTLDPLRSHALKFPNSKRSDESRLPKSEC